MRRRFTSGWLAVALVSLSGLAHAQELGDVNGDGRVSFADAFLLDRWLTTGLNAFEPAPGSTDVDAVFCTDTGDLPSLVYLEALRRASPESLPHFVERWPSAAAEADAPAVDETVSLEVMPLVHGSDQARVELQVRLSSPLPVDFVSFVLRADGLDLRPARLESANRIEEPMTLRTISEYYLISGGLLAAHSDELRNPFSPRTLAPSAETLLRVHAVLPRGTPPGSYRVDLLPSAEIVTPFGEIIRPSIASGDLRITRAIENGHNLPFPPLEFDDGAARRIPGTAEFRVTDAEANPGEEVSVTVQIRTPRAVNRAYFLLDWDSQALDLIEARAAYVDPELGRPRALDHHIEVFGGSPALDLPASITYRYYPFPLDVADDGAVTEIQKMAALVYHPYSTHSAPPSLKFIAPLGEWVDLLEVRFRVLPEARGRGSLSVRFLDNEVGAARAQFLPYGASCEEASLVWQQETRTTAGTITVLGDDEPPPEPEPPVDPEDANKTMKLLSVLVAQVVLVTVAAVAETGDFDGDGQLTIGDVVRIQANGRDPMGVSLAPGSLEAFTES